MSSMYADNQDYMGMSVSERSTFITRTYTHLLGAVLSFIGLEVWIFKSGHAQGIANVLMHNWLLVLGGFMLIGWLGSKFASRAESKVSQYVGLGLYVIAEAIIFVPLLYIAESIGGGPHRERRADHRDRLLRALDDRVRDPQGLLIHARSPDVGRGGRDHRRDQRGHLWASARRVVLDRDDRARWGLDPLRHL